MISVNTKKITNTILKLHKIKNRFTLKTYFLINSYSPFSSKLSSNIYLDQSLIFSFNLSLGLVNYTYNVVESC